jgi:hypothetical protein
MDEVNGPPISADAQIAPSPHFLDGIARRLKDEVRDLARMRDERDVSGIQLDRRRMCLKSFHRSGSMRSEFSRTRRSKGYIRTNDRLRSMITAM